MGTHIEPELASETPDPDAKTPPAWARGDNKMEVKLLRQASGKRSNCYVMKKYKLKQKQPLPVDNSIFPAVGR